MLNKRASSDARHARSGKDAMLYDENGNALAQVDSFQSKAAFNNSTYNPCGQNMELEVNNTVGVSLTISEITVMDGYLFNKVFEAISNGESPVLTLDGVIEGRNKSQERVTYRECIFSGEQDIQNVSTGDFIKRSFSLHCNGKPEYRSALTI